MKSFFKTTLSVMLGIFLMQLIGLLISLCIIISSLASTQSSNVDLPRSNAGLKIDMSKIILEEYNNVESPISGILTYNGNWTVQDIAKINILDAVRAINDAASDPAIKYIYLKPDGVSGGLAQLEEFRNALVDFRKSGKPVIAYMNNATNAGYYLATAADKIYMNSAEGTSNMIMGFSGRLVFLKDILDYFGIEVQLIRHGKYKSAGEMYVRNQISKENYEQNKAFIDCIWNSWSGEMSQARGISQEKFNKYVDNLTLVDGNDLYDARLVDGLLTRGGMKEKLLSLHNQGTRNLQFASLADYVTVHKLKWQLKNTTDRVAVIYANGQIVDSPAQECIVGDELAKLIAEVCADSTIHNVVFRVNSPGGSVLASDKIRIEMDRLCATKNVVASYGDYAASGGYWISANCPYIVADHSTLTGSIGVFARIPNLSGLFKKAKINFTTINSNKHSDMLTGMKHFDAEEVAFMQKSVENIYAKFVGIVAQGRMKSQSYIDSIAQGRVWAGDDALRVGLVDDIGDLRHAVVLAASKENPSVQFDDITIVQYPKTITGIEAISQLLNSSKGDNDVLLSQVSSTPFENLYKTFKGVLQTTTTTGVYAQLPFYIDIQ